MYVLHHAHLLARSLRDGAPPLGGELCVSAAGGVVATAGFQVWMHTLPPGAHTPLQRHGGELVSLALSGSGKLLVGGGPLRFQSPCTLMIPPGTDFQVVNNATVPLQMVLVFTQAPVPVVPPGA